MAFLPLDSPRSPGCFQIVVTLGPASQARARALAVAGATSFRLNASHLTPDAVRAWVVDLRSELPDAPVVIDLQGAKMRLGVFSERQVTRGERLRLALAPLEPEVLPLPHPELFAVVSPGETLSLDDDRMRIRLTSVSLDGLEGVALVDGKLRPRKGVNVVEHPVTLDDLPAHDQGIIDALDGMGGIAWAFSFMRDGAEACWIRRRMPGAVVVGKIEHAQALENLAAIDLAVNVSWICRGDLGAQLGMPGLAHFVSGLAPASWTRPMVMAGQVLEHLTGHAEPTRSEVCHLHDLVMRGFAGVVLSDETAVGCDPEGAVRHAATLVRAWLG